MFHHYIRSQFFAKHNLEPNEKENNHPKHQSVKEEKLKKLNRMLKSIGLNQQRSFDSNTKRLFTSSQQKSMHEYIQWN